MTILQAIILGIVQGLTEFLPVSSSGHLVVIQELLGVKTGQNIVFETVVHAATVLSTITILWREIVGLISKFFKFTWNTETQYICKLLLSMIPVMIVGLFLKDVVETVFSEGVVFVGCMLIVTAILLSLTQFIKYKERKDIGFGAALIMGLAQAIAVLPGISRSGATISTGIILGLKKEEVAKFSFLMVLIPILGEAFLGLIGGDFTYSSSGIAIPTLIAGFLAAYLSGLLACKFMINIVKRANLIWFSLYCLIIGVVVIVVGLL